MKRQDTNIITLSPDLYSEGSSQLYDKNRDELYESNYVFGQTLHYVPDIANMSYVPFIEGYTFELLDADEIKKLYGIQGFENSLAFDQDGKTPTCIVLIPFYSASVTNIASQAVAIRSGYMPLWTDTFGVRKFART